MNDDRSFPIAHTATGREVRVSLARSPQILIVGSSGSGKSTCLETLILRALQQYADGGIVVVIVDPKQISFLGGWRRCAYVFDESPRDFLKVGNALVNEAERRYAAMRSSGSSADPGIRVLVVIEECPDFFNNTELIKAHRAELQECFVKLSNKARGCGFTICYSTQSPLVEALPGAIRNNCGNRFIFKLNSPEMAKAATGDRVEEANPVLLNLRGEAFIMTDCTGGYYERAVVDKVGDEERERILSTVPERPYFYALDFENPEYRG